MFERYTDEARAAVVAASTIARRVRSQAVMPEHLVWGVLYACNADAASISTQPTGVPTLMSRLIRVLFPDEIHYHADAVVALHLATGEAAARGHQNVTPEHMLFALLSKPASRGASFLRAHGADIEELRREVEGILAASSNEEKVAAHIELCAKLCRLPWNVVQLEDWS